MRPLLVFSIFVLLLSTSSFTVPHMFAQPPQTDATRTIEASRLGAVVYQLPNGFFCRFTSFDNESGELSPGTTNPCGNAIHALQLRPPSERRRTFKWGHD
jgi:hypothetical protein